MSQLSIRLKHNLNNSLTDKVLACILSLSHHLPTEPVKNKEYEYVGYLFILNKTKLCLWITMEGQEKMLQQVQIWFQP